MKDTMSNFNHGELYDFVLDWSMGKTSKKILCKKFVEMKWNFSAFQEETRLLGMWANSMYALLYAEDFAE